MYKIFGLSLLLITAIWSMDAYALSLTPNNAYAEEEMSKTNNPPEAEEFQSLEPGAVIYLPNGQQAYIEQVLDNGYYRTSLGQVISDEGVVIEGLQKGAKVTVDQKWLEEHSNSVTIRDHNNVDIDLGRNTRIKDPTGQVTEVPDWRKAKPVPVTPKVKPGQVAEPDKPTQVTEAPDWRKAKPVPVTPKVQPEVKPGQGQTVVVPETVTPDIVTGPGSIAELLPSTTIAPGGKTQVRPGSVQGEGQGKGKGGGKGEGKGEGAGQAEGKGKGAGKGEGKAQPAPKSGKPKAGEPMRIPQEAIASGNLGFLEGCWQGTRPEYFSKRIIKECFCFGANGKNGKRRIYDQGARTCIGATRANLAKNGVLSVTSEGAACSDGERWGSAKMECRNSGPKTPCSWIFTDAGNGQQAYEIPFIRVNSCGR